MRIVLSGLILLSLAGIAPAKDSTKAVVHPPRDSVKSIVAPACSVARVAFAMRIDENRETIGEAKVFPAAVKQIYCWSQLDCGNKPLTVKHVWYKDGKKMDAIVIAAKTGHARIASRKTIVPGAWRVDVIKDSTEVIGSGQVTVK